MSQKGLRVEFQLPSQRKTKEASPAPIKDPVPRIVRLLALAHKWERMVRRDEVKDYAEIARRMGLSRARVTQVCSLILLTPLIQAHLLDGSTCVVATSTVRCAARCPWWPKQERLLSILLDTPSRANDFS